MKINRWPVLLTSIILGISGLFSLKSNSFSFLGTLPSNPVYLPLVDNQITGPSINGCPVFPPDNIWNTPVDKLPLDANSDAYINTIGATRGLHPDFGTVWAGAPNGIPFTAVTGSQPLVPIIFNPYGSESDPGPYPMPANAAVEGVAAGGSYSRTSADHHVLVVDSGNCKLYELYQGQHNSDGSWTASSGAVFDLRSNALRPLGWTSADAAGLSMFPGLVRYDEASSGAIRHAIRFTVNATRDTYVWPATHIASSNTGTNYPPMGQRFRLKASVDISGYPEPVKTIFQAFKTYGVIVADNGSSWFISGAPDPRWNDDLLVSNFSKLHGSDFEAVDTTGLMINPDSGQAKSLP